MAAGVLIFGAAGANGAEPGGRIRKVSSGPTYPYTVYMTECGPSCVPVALVEPPPPGRDCYWEHVPVPADRFTVIVKRVRVCH